MKSERFIPQREGEFPAPLLPGESVAGEMVWYQMCHRLAKGGFYRERITLRWQLLRLI